MIPEESVWIGENILELTLKVENPSVLNVGSSTKNFREVHQPHVYQNIFRVLMDKNIVVSHLDIKQDEGVDIVGDLNEPGFLQLIQAKKYSILLCSNLLEHILDPGKICQALENSVAQGGYIIVTGPYVYRHHNDPIDTMFRPSPEELHKMFPNCDLIKGEVLEINDTFFRGLMRDPRELMVILIRLLTPFYKFTIWKNLVFKSLPYLFTRFKVTCVILKRKE